MICETIGSRPRQSICKYRLQDPCAKLHSFSHIMIEVPLEIVYMTFMYGLFIKEENYSSIQSIISTNNFDFPLKEKKKNEIVQCYLHEYYYHVCMF